MWVTLDYRNGTVFEKSAQYAEEPRCSGIVTESAHQPATTKAGPGSASFGRDVYLSSSVPSPIFVLQVKDNVDVSSKRRQLDWEIDLSCMTTIGGCRDPRKVLYGVLLEDGLADARGPREKASVH